MTQLVRVRRHHSGLVRGAVALAAWLLAGLTPGAAVAAPAKTGAALAEWWDARARGDDRAARQALLQAGAQQSGARVLVQVHRAGSDPQRPGRAQWSGADVAALQQALGNRLRVQTVGLDLLDAEVEVTALPALVQLPLVGFVQFPWRGHPLVGPTRSEGAALLDSEARTCRSAAGAGQTIAVLDAGFEGLSASMQSGELPDVIEPPQEVGGSHGTMCAEVVADVAPAARIWPVQAPTFAGLQSLVKHITTGNARSVDVVSHSVAWFGMSFGRDLGQACQATAQVLAAGVAWVNASGNNGGGKFFQAEWSDPDGDGDADLPDGSDRLQFRQYWGPLQLVLDYDDYEARTVNLDARILRQEPDGSWKEVGKSSWKPGKYVAPMEQIAADDLDDGVYALQVVAKTPVPKGMRWRVVKLSDGQGDFSVWSEHGSVYDPGNCAGVLTVGAAAHHTWQTSPTLESYSSFGPLVDGRSKPELIAPTGVATSQGAFYGTSAACPHAAGAVAVVAAATGLGPIDAAALLVQAASPTTAVVPDERWGAGLLRLSPAAVGASCTTPGASTLACTTACGSSGTASCGPTCALQDCVPPAEQCNGVDDDCDNLTDEGCSIPAEDIAAAEVDASAADTSEAPLQGREGTVSGGCAASRGSGSAWSAVALLGLVLAAWRSRRQGRTAFVGGRSAATPLQPNL